MDAIKLLETDHRKVESLFARFEALGEGGEPAKRRLVDRMIVELSRHAAIEELLFYPAVRDSAREDKLVLEALEEHAIVKWELAALEGLGPSTERFDAKVKVLIDTVSHHVDEEEHELFPLVRQVMLPMELEALGLELGAREEDRAHAPAPARARLAAGQHPRVAARGVHGSLARPREGARLAAEARQPGARARRARVAARGGLIANPAGPSSPA